MRGGSPRLRPTQRALAAAAVLVAAACGGSSGTSDASGAGDGAPEETDGPGVLLRGTAPAAEGSVHAFVTLRPVDGEPEPTDIPSGVRPEPTIDQFGLQFSPTALVVDVGVPLTFTNSEGALAHNVHVRSVETGASIFNEDANSGDVLELTLEEPGGYDVLCDMHPGMTAFAFATDDPFVAMADADGTFSFPGVPAGSYTLRLWTAAEGFSDPVAVTVTANGTDIDLRTQR